eukprot:3220735-Lingulodinium_polyedra.AAC.1
MGYTHAWEGCRNPHACNVGAPRRMNFEKGARRAQGSTRRGMTPGRPAPGARWGQNDRSSR